MRKNRPPAEFAGDPGCRHALRLCDVGTGRVLSRKLTYVFHELKKFDKRLEELDSLERENLQEIL